MDGFVIPGYYNELTECSIKERKDAIFKAGTGNCLSACKVSLVIGLVRRKDEFILCCKDLQGSSS